MCIHSEASLKRSHGLEDDLLEYITEKTRQEDIITGNITIETLMESDYARGLNVFDCDSHMVSPSLWKGIAYSSEDDYIRVVGVDVLEASYPHPSAVSLIEVVDKGLFGRVSYSWGISQ